MNDCSWFASKWTLEETNKFYESTYDENDIEEVKEVDIEKEGMWIETTDPNDIISIGDSDEISSTFTYSHLGDLMRRGNEVYKFTSYKEVIALNGDFKEPYEIATTEW